MFHPPRCPYPSCHLHPAPGFSVRRGFYQPRCRNHPVPRFLCRLCRRSFSRQSFRADRYHKKPHLNAAFLHLMVSCVGLRQAARVLQASRRDRSNPLFPINHTNARLRHFLSRLRRRTWCVSKSGQRLQGHLAIAALWVNYCRGITNRTRITPAQGLGLAAREYRPEELVGWRQDWGALSPALVA